MGKLLLIVEEGPGGCICNLAFERDGGRGVVVATSGGETSGSTKIDGRELKYTIKLVDRVTDETSSCKRRRCKCTAEVCVEGRCFKIEACYSTSECILS